MDHAGQHWFFFSAVGFLSRSIPVGDLWQWQMTLSKQWWRQCDGSRCQMLVSFIYEVLTSCVTEGKSYPSGETWGSLPLLPLDHMIFGWKNCLTASPSSPRLPPVNHFIEPNFNGALQWKIIQNCPINKCVSDVFYFKRNSKFLFCRWQWRQLTKACEKFAKKVFSNVFQHLSLAFDYKNFILSYRNSV